MNTKKIRCVIQTNPSYQEGDGDQAAESNPKQYVQNSGELREFQKYEENFTIRTRNQTKRIILLF